MIRKRIKYAIKYKSDGEFILYLAGNDIMTFETIKEAREYIDRFIDGKSRAGEYYKRQDLTVVRIRQTTEILKEFKK